MIESERTQIREWRQRYLKLNELTLAEDRARTGEENFRLLLASVRRGSWLGQPAKADEDLELYTRWQKIRSAWLARHS